MSIMPNPNPPIGSTPQIWDHLKVGVEAENNNEKLENHQSLYVDIFETILDIVMKQERFLFSLEEQTSFHKFNAMSYPARYLLIRLCLCKRGKWHTLKSLERRYMIEVGRRAHISAAIDELCGIRREDIINAKDEEIDIIDLTMDEDRWTAAATKTFDTSSHHVGKEASPIDSQGYNGAAYIFAEDDAAASLSELLGCLTHYELKVLGKQMKVAKSGQSRSMLMDAILSSSSIQSTLIFPGLTSCSNSSISKRKQLRQLSLGFSKDGRMKTQTGVVRELVLKVIGRCIRISPALFTLFDRLNIVFFRSTTYSTSLLLPALLTAFRKRKYVKMDYCRTPVIFPSRQALLDYEKALALEAHVDEALSGRSGATALPTKPSSLIHGNIAAKGKEVPSKISRHFQAAEAVREIWSNVYEHWQALVACKDEAVEKSPALSRFDCGHILTRIVYKGAEALAALKEHDLEIKVLEALLAQTKWRKGCRGAWYDRLALVLMTHCEKNQETWEMAMDVVIRGLEDELTHLIYRPRLERRLTRLEKLLKTPMNERHKCEGKTNKAKDVYIEGVRIKNTAGSDFFDKTGRIKDDTVTPFISFPSSNASPALRRESTQPPSSEISGNTTINPRPWTGKSLWIGKLEEISVEQFALEYYHGLGYKGFHSEGRIVSTIFGLLFWDVIFAPVPGAFETPYQSAPLDIFEDCFCLARRELIDQRLVALKSGEGPKLLEQVFDREGPSRTLCIGVDWGFERGDLLEIVNCLGGHSLAVICQTICEDYAQRRGGIPDLLVWNPEAQTCRFVEVKSPNDKLQENQKVWIDVLISSETLVELCHVTEKGVKGKIKEARPASSQTKDPPLSGQGSRDDLESEDQDVDVEQLDQSPAVNGKRTHDSDSFVTSFTKKRRAGAS